MNDASLAKKLQEMTGSQDNIQTLSALFILRRADAHRVVRVWSKEFARARPSKHLAFLYVANDVMQNSRRKGTPCADAFASQMATVLPAAHAAATPTVGGLYDEKPTLATGTTTHTLPQRPERRGSSALVPVPSFERGPDLQLPDRSRQRPSRDIGQHARPNSSQPPLGAPRCEQSWSGCSRSGRSAP